MTATFCPTASTTLLAAGPSEGQSAGAGLSASRCLSGHGKVDQSFDLLAPHWSGSLLSSSRDSFVVGDCLRHCFWKAYPTLARLADQVALGTTAGDIQIRKVVRLAGIEPAAFRSGAERSVR